MVVHSGEWGGISSEAKDIPVDHLMYREDIPHQGYRKHTPGISKNSRVLPTRKIPERKNG